MEINWSPKNPFAILALVVVFAGTGFFVWKRSGTENPLDFFLSGKEAIVEVATMREKIDPSLRNFLYTELLREAAARKASQSEINQLQPVEILEVTADPENYYKRRIDFYRDRRTRHVDLWIRFKTPSGIREAEGSAMLSTRDHWSVVNVALQ
jgi:hypothetical protein